MGVGGTDEESEKIFLRYLQVGGNFFDTANFYQDGNSEVLLGQLIRKHNVPRDELVIATKYALPTKSSPNSYGNHKKNLVQSIDASLKRLQMDYVDILYVHYWDFTVDIQQLVRAFDDVVKSGRVLHVAISNTPAWEVARANSYAEFHALSPFISYTGNYSLSDRSLELDVIPMAKKLNIGIVPWSVLGGGKLTGRHKRGQKADSRRAYVELSEKDFQIQDVLLEIGNESGRTASQIAINWVLNKPGVTSALIGPSTLEQLEDNLKSLQFKLNAEQVERLDKVSEIKEKTFPHNFIGTRVGGIPLQPTPFNIEQ